MHMKMFTAALFINGLIQCFSNLDIHSLESLFKGGFNESGIGLVTEFVTKSQIIVMLLI